MGDSLRVQGNMSLRYDLTGLTVDSYFAHMPVAGLCETDVTSGLRPS